LRDRAGRSISELVKIDHVKDTALADGASVVITLLQYVDCVGIVEDETAAIGLIDGAGVVIAVLDNVDVCKLPSPP